MSTGSTDWVINYMDRELNELPCTPSKPCIPRVDMLYKNRGCGDLYEPEILSIGPYHHASGRLRDMEEFKWTYIRRLLKLKKETSVARYVNAAAAMEKQARQYYAELPLGETLLCILVVDGIFLIEFFRYFHFESLRDENDDASFRDERFLRQLHRDIVLLENQLPFFILSELFNMIKTNDCVVSDDNDLISLALGFFDYMVPYSLSVSRVWDVNNIDHLFGLRHDPLCLSFTETLLSREHDYIGNWENIISASGLREAGIEFRTANEGNLMNIKFVNGVLIIPQLVVSHETVAIQESNSL